jgi:CDP-glucose 4,6-dehydratase
MTAPDGKRWEGKSVFVTGATGFLGSWLVKELYAQGAKIVVLIRDCAPQSMFVSEGWLDRIPAVYGSLADRDLLRRTLCEYEVDTIFHLGAQTLVGVGKADPVGTLEANVRGTWNLLEAARQTSRVKQIVVASSDKAYGTSAELPYRETHPLQGEYPYDVSKSCTDLICRMYAITYRLPVAITRCGNLFGGGDLNFSRTVPGVIMATLKGEPFRIRSDGRYVRDFLYVRDAAEAYMRLAERMRTDESLIGEAFNFSLEIKLTVLEIAEKVVRMIGRPDLRPIVENVASSEVREQYMVAEKARTRLGWKPGYGLDKGLEETIAWYREFLQRQTADSRRASQS